MMAAGEGSFQIIEMGLEKEMIELDISSEIRDSADSGKSEKSVEPGEKECLKENGEGEREEVQAHKRHLHKPVEQEKDEEKGVEEKDEEKGVEEKEEWWEEEEYDEDLDYYETEDNNDRSEDSPATGPTQVDIQSLTEPERLLLVFSWELLQDKVSNVGVSAFNELFQLSPQAVQFFPKLNQVDPNKYGGNTGDEEKFTEILRDHSIRILGIVGLIIRDMSKMKGEDPKNYYSFYKFAFQLGEKHFRYGANPRLMGLLGIAFATAMRQTLLELDNCEEVEDAWKSFFSVMTSWMRRGFLYVQNKGREPDIYKIPLAEVLQKVVKPC
ncbi:uncharacterized protein LOC111700587 isoform X2 [Eurytemora carolleeae]|uniref:uncharacterized protein LOC111700587 isoform X2 n=1 Tax=Eurytemora carolleeae TaxID=1294199 RepID=UPI000C75E2E8|nr:uncharacterized protein LOC111700587 isoform X2 [Eurytemora carolleeae]|eukprot:XP_023327321.1 uncharacterized protein LOC111700587 isoform X2 [Eurytemora affinis]